MNNFIQLENNFIGTLCAKMETLTDKIHRINKNLGKSYAEILEETKNSLHSHDMSLDEYKEFISEKILQTPCHISRFKDDVTVVLSDKTFAAMKNNSDYESWVLNRIADELKFPDYLCFYPGNNGRNEVYQFGETKEDYRGTSFAKPSNKNFKQPEKSYWELRLERLKKRIEAEQEFLQEKERLLLEGEQLAQRRAVQNIAIGLDNEVKPQLPITGIPAKLLLDLLG